MYLYSIRTDLSFWIIFLFGSIPRMYVCVSAYGMCVSLPAYAAASFCFKRRPQQSLPAIWLILLVTYWHNTSVFCLVLKNKPSLHVTTHWPEKHTHPRNQHSSPQSLTTGPHYRFELIGFVLIRNLCLSVPGLKHGCQSCLLSYIIICTFKCQFIFHTLKRWHLTRLFSHRLNVNRCATPCECVVII